MYNSGRESYACHTMKPFKPVTMASKRADVASQPGSGSHTGYRSGDRFTTEYKLHAFLTEADACTKPGEIGALLRREGLYRSHLDKWRTARQTGTLQALTPQRARPPG